MTSETVVEPTTVTFVAKALALLRRVEEVDEEGWLMDDKIREAARDFHETVDALGL